MPWRAPTLPPTVDRMTTQPSAAAPRPRSTFRVLATLVLALVVGLGIVGACVRAYVDSVPARTVSITRTELIPGTPRFIPVTSFGADGRNTHGVWVTLGADGTPTAFSSRGPERGCFVAYRPEQSAFRDGCTQALYAPADGSALTGEATRGLDAFRVTAGRTAYTIDLDRTLLGACRDAAASGCSRPGAPAERQTTR